MYKELYDVHGFENWKVIKKINKGWSDDIKFYIEDYDANKLLLRISSIGEYNNKRKEFEFIKKCNKLNFLMSKALEFGICNNECNVYMLLTWVEGDSLNDVLSNFKYQEQYKFGLDAGRILNKIHSLRLEDTEDYTVENKKDRMLINLIKYENSVYRVKGDNPAIDFVKANIEKIDILTPVFKHGDFHVGNLVLSPSNTIGVIDFNRWGYGDRYEEFQRIQSFDVEVSVPFSIGKIHGYFNGNPTVDFWSVLAVYVACNSLNSIIWAEKFGQKDIEGMQKHCLKAFNDYDNFNTVIPKWYKSFSNKYIGYIK